MFILSPQGGAPSTGNQRGVMVGGLLGPCRPLPLPPYVVNGFLIGGSHGKVESKGQWIQIFRNLPSHNKYACIVLASFITPILYVSAV